MKKKSCYRILSLIFAFAFVLSTGLTFASWKVSSSTVNTITMGSVTGKIIEVYEQGQTVYPAATVDKDVKVQNIGNVDVFVRVNIEKNWGASRDSDGDLIVDPSLNTDNIIIQYDSKNWYYNDNDGYYYYLDALKPAEVTQSLFKSFYIDGKTTGGEYNNKEADIVVTMEMVQAGGNGLSHWNMTAEELGITYTQNDQTMMVTTVDFENPKKGFTFEVNDGDLFANFKDLIPGESRSQELTVTNNWSQDVEIFLHANYIEQTQATDETRELIDNLLKKYARITVASEDGEQIYSGPIWGNPTAEDSSEPSMKEPYSLGDFASGQTKKMYVNLYLDENMDNEYKDLLGKIEWVFTAEGNEIDSDTATETDTGSETDTDTATDTDTGSETDTDTATDSDTESETDTDTATDSDTDTGTSTDTSSQTTTTGGGTTGGSTTPTGGGAVTTISEAVKTGMHTDTLVFASLAVLSGILFVVTVIAGKRQKEE